MARIWSNKRKWRGNWIPALFCIPSIVVGVWIMVRRQEILGPGIYWIASSPVIGWVALNFLGLYQNGWMRREFLREKPLATDRGWFVGFARPRYSGFLDPHEEVGFLLLHEGSLEFIGEEAHHRLERREIQNIRFRPNVHSLLFLGRWICIEALVGGKPVRMLIEPREKNILLANRIFGKKLLAILKEWHQSS